MAVVDQETLDHLIESVRSDITGEEAAMQVGSARQTLDTLECLIKDCGFPGFAFKIDADGEDKAFPWFQIVCPDGRDTRTGEPLPWKARKWKLSYHMTDTEVVQTVWAAVQRALLHEACELFTFQGKAIFDRHISVHALVDLLSNGNGEDLMDGREPLIQGAAA